MESRLSIVGINLDHKRTMHDSSIESLAMNEREAAAESSGFSEQSWANLVRKRWRPKERNKERKGRELFFLWKKNSPPVIHNKVLQNRHDSPGKLEKKIHGNGQPLIEKIFFLVIKSFWKILTKLYFYLSTYWLRQVTEILYSIFQNLLNYKFLKFFYHVLFFVSLGQNWKISRKWRS